MIDLRKAVALLERGDWRGAHEIVYIMEGDLPDVRAEIAALRAALH